MNSDAILAENTSLKQQLSELETTVSKLSEEIAHLAEQLKLAQQKQFGASSEKAKKPDESPHMELFDEAEVLSDESVAEPVLDIEETTEESVDVAAHTRKKTKRVSLPDTLTRADVIHDLPESEI